MDGLVKRGKNVRRAGALFNMPIADICLLAFVAIFPFVNFLSNNVMSSLSIGGISPINIMLMASLVLITFFQLLNKPSNSEQSLVLTVLVLLFVVILKLLFQGDSNGLTQWASQYQYYFLVPLFAFALSNVKTNLSKFIEVIICISVIVCMVSIYSFITGDYFGLVSYAVGLSYSIVGTNYMRMMGLFGSPNVAASYFLVVLVMTFSPNRLNRLFLRIAQLLLVACLLLTFSRAATIIGLVFALLRLSLRNDAKVISIKKMLIPLFIVGLAVVLPLMVERGIYFWAFNDDFFNNPRLLKWMSGLSQIFQNMVLGVGFSSEVSGTPWSKTLSDNSYLLCAAGFGVPATVVFYWTLFSTFFKNRMGSVRGWTLFGLIAGLLFFYDFMNFYPVNYLVLVLALTERSIDNCSNQSILINRENLVSEEHTRCQ